MKPLNPTLQAWVDAPHRHRLSHAQAQMARELGMNPAKLGKLDNHKQEQWKLPLAQFIAQLYFKRFGRRAPEMVTSVEDRARLEQQKREAGRVAKQPRRAQAGCNDATSIARSQPVGVQPRATA